jgi:hypothetical protein
VLIEDNPKNSTRPASRLSVCHVLLSWTLYLCRKAHADPLQLARATEAPTDFHHDLQEMKMISMTMYDQEDTYTTKYWPAGEARAKKTKKCK